jgi:hypothetical protein
MAEAEPAYLALDPGETTGWAKFDAKGQILSYGQFKQTDQTEWITKHLTSTLLGVICEEYRIYNPKRQKRWSRNQTSKNEGAFQLLAEMRNVPFYLQPAANLTIGLKWAGLGELPSNHAISHQYCAIAHGTYWLRMNGILKPTIPGE